MNPGVLQEAIVDLRYLLDRGYPRSSAVEFVANHFRLSKLERYFLTRCVFSAEESRAHLAKLVGIKEVRGKRLGIDGYNVLITLESLMRGYLVVRCDDGILRDLRGVFGKYRFSEEKRPVLEALVTMLKSARPARADIFLDKQVSRSGELAAALRAMLRENRLEGTAITTAQTDTKLRDYQVVASSDRVVVDRARRVLDLPAEFARKRGIKVVDLRRLTPGSLRLTSKSESL
jgi:hypothetical protein